MSYGHFDDAARAYIITDPLTPRPWINYLGNRRLTAFISQNAGGLLWYLEPQSRRITRYHYIPAPGDRPGFYVYVKDKRTGTTWNPHFAPTNTPLDRFECRVEPGVTSFIAVKDGVRVEAAYAIAPDDDVMVWHVRVANVGKAHADLQLCSYLEFGLLEFMREVIGWCYLKTQFGLEYEPALRAIRYDYHVFEAPFCPRMAFGCTAEVSGWDCSRDAFVGRTGSLERPAALAGGLTNSNLPSGGHGCGALGVEVRLASGASTEFAYLFVYGETWEETDALLARYSQAGAAARAVESVRETWRSRFDAFQAKTGEADMDRFVNVWNPYNCEITLELARIISTDHMGLDGLRYRDTTQDALAPAHFDPEFSLHRMRQVFAQQKSDGGGCFAFYPYNRQPTTDKPHRSDNAAWQIYTITALISETGDWAILDEVIPFRDGGDGTVYDHLLLGLRHIESRRGPHGLPTLFHADWNDGLAVFGDEAAESVMLGMQMVYSCRQMSDVARRRGRVEDAEWCDGLAGELFDILNSDAVWDGEWYRRLLLSNGKVIGSAGCREGRIFLNPQSWAVLSGVGDKDGRGRLAMQRAAEMLDTPFGLRILEPPYTGIPEPEDPPLGSKPGTNENGSIFCHANTWAIMAEAMLGNAERAFKYYEQLLPSVVSERAGPAHYEREPYVYVSSILGPSNPDFGRAGISWLTGTASWMYIAATQWLLGVRPTLDGLTVAPCLPAGIRRVRVDRRYRGCAYEIEIDNAGREQPAVQVDGKPWRSPVLPLLPGRKVAVRVSV